MYSERKRIQLQPQLDRCSVGVVYTSFSEPRYAYRGIKLKNCACVQTARRPKLQCVGRAVSVYEKWQQEERPGGQIIWRMKWSKLQLITKPLGKNYDCNCTGGKGEPKALRKN